MSNHPVRTDAQMGEIRAGLAALAEKLDFVQSISAEERREMLHLGDRSISFVQKAKDLAQRDDSFLPRSFSVEEMQRDLQAYQQLEEIRQHLQALLSKVTDTQSVAGSEAYSAALVVYKSAKAHGKTEGLEAVLDELGQRFARRLG